MGWEKPKTHRYRAPEILMGVEQYTTPADIWSMYTIGEDMTGYYASSLCISDSL